MMKVTDNMKLRYLLISAISGLAVSLIIHFLTMFNVYKAPGWLLLSITGWMFLVWMATSGYIKQIGQMDDVRNPWKEAMRHCPDWLEYLTYFFIVYAIINFALSLSFEPTEGFFNLDVPRHKIRGLSGFWLAFFSTGIAIAVGRNRIKN
ncbi:MAG TPA: hypothetical protein ENK44_05190 [Caldithrix abyssi]|uniref:Uncharacterized protein n=1 Tax=Caldithrix abyssi TaxID=187145 RepID=A0A7V4U196_CALAY|nr:hypothetical protein [Caldithrix abyssi]